MGPVDPQAVEQLRRRLDALVERARRRREESVASLRALPPIDELPLIDGHATHSGCVTMQAGTIGAANGFFRDSEDLQVSSLGVGTSTGTPDSATDAAYVRSIVLALRGGVNLIDTSLNYRHQRSERAVGRAVHRFIDSGGRRDAIVVCTKGGYLVHGGFNGASLDATDIAGGIHCMAPAFLSDQIERSRRNLGLSTLDVYYLHNPELQAGFVSSGEFERRLCQAFELLETAVQRGSIRRYGVATWTGLYDRTISLPSLVALAQQVAGTGGHHFVFVQLPVNLGLMDAATSRRETGQTVLETASDLGLTVVASATLAGANLARQLRSSLGDALRSLPTDALRALQYSRSAPGVTSALVGMRSTAHVVENLSIAEVSPLDPALYRR